MLARSLSRLFVAITLLTMVAALAVGRDARADVTVVKIGTLAPKSSPWGQVYATWAKAVNEKSGGRLELQIFYNGNQGDEAAMIGKIKSGALDGAAVTAVGLGKVYKPILALQIPGLFTTWAKLDKARDAMKAEFEKGATDANFTIVGWADVGAVRLMTKGYEVRSGADFAGKKPFAWRDDPVQAILFQVIGGVTPVPLSIPEVLPNLNTGAINGLSAPALVAEQLQWASKLDTIVADNSGMSIGAIVMSSARLDALPADLRTILVDTGKIAANALTKRIRSEDDAAFGRLKAKMKVITLTAEQRAAWEVTYKKLRERLGQGTFTPELIAKLEGLAK